MHKLEVKTKPVIVLVNVVQHAKIRLVLTFRAVRLGVPIIYNHQSCLLHRNQEKHHVLALIQQPIRFWVPNTKLGTNAQTRGQNQTSDRACECGSAPIGLHSEPSDWVFQSFTIISLACYIEIKKNTTCSP